MYRNWNIRLLDNQPEWVIQVIRVGQIYTNTEVIYGTNKVKFCILNGCQKCVTKKRKK